MRHVDEPSVDPLPVDPDHDPVVPFDLLGPARQLSVEAVEVAGDVGDALVDAEPEGQRALRADDLHLELGLRIEGGPVEVGEGDLLPRAQRAPGEDQDRPVGAGDQELAGDERGGDDAETDGRSAEPAREAAGLVQGSILRSGSIGM
jgi:hypothetical protein